MEATLEKAQQHHREGRLDQAVEIVGELLRRTPNDLDARFLLGQIAAERALLSEAISNFERVLMVAPDHLGALTGIADCHERQFHATCWNTTDAVRDMEAAAAYWKQALELDPQEPEHAQRLTMAHCYLGQFPEMVEAERYVADLLATSPMRALHRSLGIRFLLSSVSQGPHKLGFIGGRPGMAHIGTLDLYAKLDALGWIEPKRTIVLAPEGRVANPCFLNYFSPYCSIVRDPRLIEALKPLVPLFDHVISESLYVRGRFMPSMEAIGRVAHQWSLEGRPPLVRLTEVHRERGWATLERLGIPRGAWFVGLHIRERGFYNDAVGNELNNCDVATYLPAIEEITRRGGWVVRLGDPSMSQVPTMERLFDYCHSEVRSDWMDVFLAASCRFFLGSGSGLYWVPLTFGVPAIITNAVPLGHGRPFTDRDLYLPKRYRRIRDQSLVGFGEAWQTVAHAFHGTVMRDRGIDVIDNSPEEILAVTREMFERVEGTLAYSEEDERREQRFLDLARAAGRWTNDARVGRDYLRRYEDLLQT